jgi:hypothetical protein
MVTFFFNKNLTSTELINKINSDFEMNDGYIIIQRYDSENNILEINDKIVNNNTLLHGKIVKFKMNLEDVLQKIDDIDECKFINKNSKYTVNTIWANKQSGGCCKTYIIY